MKDKLKVLFVGDQAVPTGFSTVLTNIIRPLKDRIDAIGLGVNYKGDPHDMGYPIYPAMVSGYGNIYGLDRLTELLHSDRPDVLFLLNDAWVLSYYLDQIKKTCGDMTLPRIVTYFPVDAEGHNLMWYRDFDIVNRAFTYTEFGKKVVLDVLPEMKLEIMPHGVNQVDFYRTNESHMQSKIDLFGNDIIKKMGNLEKMFIVLNANRNQPRKKLDITMEGFSLFAKDKPKEVRLCMHSGLTDSYINLGYIAQRYGISDRMVLTNQNNGVPKVKVSKLNKIYNACDIGINTSLGEGWGLVNMEHAVTGAAQIVPNHSACAEVFDDCGLLMDAPTKWTFENSQTIGRLVSPDEVANKLEIIYTNPKLREELAEKARSKFLQPEYQWDNIAEEWLKVFEDVTSSTS